MKIFSMRITKNCSAQIPLQPISLLMKVLSGLKKVFGVLWHTKPDLSGFIQRYHSMKEFHINKTLTI